jgi:polysaccharide export outer membrane protein
MKRITMNRMAILGFALLLSGTGIVQAAQRDDKNDRRKTPVATPKNGAASSADDKTGSLRTPTNSVYVIGPEDVLDVTVWKESEVSRVVPVRPDGRISLPLTNDVQAAGLSPDQLAATVTEKLRTFLNEPKVTVIVTAMNSQRVFVVGEVLRAGAFPLLPGMTILQAISSAGGFTTFADVKKIHVVRMRDGKQVELPFNYRDVLKGDKPEQNINLDPGDTIVVP